MCFEQELSVDVCFYYVYYKMKGKLGFLGPLGVHFHVHLSDLLISVIEYCRESERESYIFLGFLVCG